jgi:GTP-binding protein
VKIRYITQPKAPPPFWVLFGYSVASIPESYKRCLVNGLRETFGPYGATIRLSMRPGGDNPYARKRSAIREIFAGKVAPERFCAM